MNAPFRTACLVAGMALGLAGLVPHAHAQGIPLTPPGPHTIIGVVTDEVGMPIANADIIVEAIHRRVSARADGSFRIDSVPEGEYEIYARRMGYIGVKTAARVGENGAVVLVQLVQYRYTLPAVQTTAARGGLSGTIADAAFSPLANIRVSVVGGSGKARTDARGTFFLPLAPGSYVIQLDGSGYVKQLVGAQVPADSGRQVAAWMERQVGKADPVRSRNLFDLEQRLIRGSRTRLRIVTRDDMARLGTRTVLQLANLTAVRPMAPDCLVSVNGGPDVVPLWLLDADDIEFVELSTTRPFTSQLDGSSIARGPTSIYGSPERFSTRIDWDNASPTSAGASCGMRMVAWMRQ